jgi:uncharacterized protein (TIGR00297 family)
MSKSGAELAKAQRTYHNLGNCFKRCRCKYRSVLQGSVLGSGLAGVVCAWAALATTSFGVWQAGFVASFGSKLADTVSSEVGKGFGRTTFLITSFKRVKPGTEGAISLEGTLAGVFAAFLYGLVASSLGQVTSGGAVQCTIAAAIANLAESYIGATAQGKVKWLTNDTVNVLQTCLAAALGIALNLKV